jgi:uncharacterized protein YggT (Ycf19 family)
MAKEQKPSDITLVSLKGARFLTYIVYIYAIVATVFLSIGSILLFFGANTSAGFVQFIYNGATNFLEPFRGIWPPKQVSETGYFSASAFFAIIIYLLVALALSSLIAFLTAKLVQHEAELQEAQK